jgi:hypothetical protein
MMIRTHDDKKEAMYDLEGLEEYFRDLIEGKEQSMRMTVAKAEAYLDGYKEALYAVAGILSSGNYRVMEEKKE